MKKRYKNIFDKERRDFLKILASAGITKQLLRASPLVWGAMYARLADAQTSTVNKSVIVYVPNGCIPSRWLPNSSLSNLTSLPMSAPYNGVRTQCNFLRNMGHHRGGHGVMDTVINNSWGGDSFDVNIGRTVGANRPFMYVNLGCMNGGYGITRNGDSGQMVPPEASPYNAFRRLFSGTSSSSTSTTGGTNPKLAVVDSHKDAIAALRTKLGTYEKARLDSHLNAINAFEQRLGPSSSSSSSGGTSCSAGTGPTQYALTNDTFQTQARDMANIIALALQCNLTASASLVLGNEGGQFAMPYLSYTGIYHQSIHCCGGGPEFDVTRGHLSAQSANVIQELINKGVINSTIFMEVTDMGDGNAHTSSDIPLIMAGGGGRIQRGVSNAGGGSYTPMNMLSTAGAVLGANQHSAYTYDNVPVIPGVIV